MNKPRVLIAMATSILGGPGKGLVQFLHHGGLNGCSPLVVNYVREPEHGETEFVRKIKEAGLVPAPLYQHKTFDSGLFNQALNLVRKHRINLLESNGYKSHILCWWLRKKTGLPWVAVVHGWTRENLRIRFYNATEHVAILGADKVVAVSDSVRKRLLPPLRKRAHVIPNAISPEDMTLQHSRSIMRRSLSLPADALVVGIVGRLSPEKGHSVFLRALAEARRKDKRLIGLVVGDGQERERLAAEAHALGLAKACLFTGHVEGPADYFSAMDIQVMPSFTEGMPYAALEGMYMGLPLVATRAGGIPEVVLDGITGLLVTTGGVQALASAIIELSASPELRRIMGEAGAARVRETFNAQKRAERILALYYSLIDRSGGR